MVEIYELCLLEGYARLVYVSIGGFESAKYERLTSCLELSVAYAVD